jgi:hypothetical protein
MRKIASLLTMLLLFSVLAFAQTRNVTGTVRDSRENLFLLPLLRRPAPEMRFRQMPMELLVLKFQLVADSQYQLQVIRFKP